MPEHNRCGLGPGSRSRCSLGRDDAMIGVAPKFGYACAASRTFIEVLV
jgi:hypothetical protein